MALVPEPPAGASSTLAIPVLVRRLLNDGEMLARAEVRLVQAQVTSRIRRAIPALLATLFGSILLFAALLTMLAALIGWLAPSLGTGNAALVVTVVTAAIGGIAMTLGLRHLNNRAAVPAAPPQEVE